jgi:hypothetical protein
MNEIRPIYGEWPEHKPGSYIVRTEDTGPDVPDEYGLEMVGPFDLTNYYLLKFDGYLVPFVRAVKVTSEGTQATTADEATHWNICDLEGQPIGTVPDDPSSMHAWTMILTTLLARQAGYSNFGKHSAPFNPFKRRMIGITASA